VSTSRKFTLVGGCGVWCGFGGVGGYDLSGGCTAGEDTGEATPAAARTSDPVPASGLRGRDRQGHDLTQVQQPGQMSGIAHIFFELVNDLWIVA